MQQVSCSGLDRDDSVKCLRFTATEQLHRRFSRYTSVVYNIELFQFSARRRYIRTYKDVRELSGSADDATVRYYFHNIITIAVN